MRILIGYLRFERRASRVPAEHLSLFFQAVTIDNNYIMSDIHSVLVNSYSWKPIYHNDLPRIADIS
jgi:hypothetical protein